MKNISEEDCTCEMQCLCGKASPIYLEYAARFYHVTPLKAFLPSDHEKVECEFEDFDDDLIEEEHLEDEEKFADEELLEEETFFDLSSLWLFTRLAMFSLNTSFNVSNDTYASSVVSCKIAAQTTSRSISPSFSVKLIAIIPASKQ